MLDFAFAASVPRIPQGPESLRGWGRRFVSQTHILRLLPEILIQGAWAGALQTTCLMLFNPHHQAGWGMAETSWEASALKLPLPGNSQVALYMSPPSTEYLPSTYESCSRDVTRFIPSPLHPTRTVHTGAVYGGLSNSYVFMTSFYTHFPPKLFSAISDFPCCSLKW